MALNNPWVGYIDRSYKQIRASVLTRLGAKVPELTDYSESNPLIIILGMFAGVAEMLNYYIDNMARESFISTCRRYSSAVKLVRLIDYRVKAAIPARADILMTIDTIPTTATTVPVGTVFQTANGILFTNTTEVVINALQTNIPVVQQEPQTDINLGVTTGVIDQIVNLPTNYVHNSLSLLVGADLWELKGTLAFSQPTDKHFVIEVSTLRIPYIRFGDNINGAVPPGGQTLLGDYMTTEGSEGNVDADTITEVVTNLVFTGVSSIEVNNSLAAVAGTDVEDLIRIKRSAPLSLKTLDRAVTQDDYRSIALLAPGVDKAEVDYNCGKTVDIYVAPNGGGIASASFTDSVKDYFEDKRMVTTEVQVIPAGESYIYIDLEATAKFRISSIVAAQDIRDILIANYNYAASKVNRSIRISDITSLIDNLDRIDYVTIKDLFIKPYPRPRNHSNPLNLTTQIRNQTEEEVTWLVDFDGIKFRYFKDGNFMGNVTYREITGQAVNTINIGDIYTFSIGVGAYEIGNIWDFKTYKSNADQVLTGLAIPVLRTQDLKINVIEQVIDNAN